uniref:Exocyst complex component SEC3A isoform X2 n=1 Tax=Rhizophora mucronata TaxID=61149 RepID=A0A2P2MS87_RHIMU
MAKSSADDEELRKVCEAAIEGTKQKIVLSIRVAKSRGVWGKSGKLGRQMAKPRVLAISTKSKGKRTKAFLRVLKYSTGGVLEPAKLYKLKHLTKVEVIANDPSGCTFTLVMLNFCISERLCIKCRIANDQWQSQFRKHLS